MIITKLSTTCHKKQLLQSLNIDPGGIAILESKMTLHLFKIENMHVGAANILKQDALSIGADLAVPRGTVVAKEQHVDAVLIATSRQLEKLCEKEKAQPFGLSTLSKTLRPFTKHTSYERPALMGIINATDDSFYAQSRYNDSSAIAAIEQMISNGAKIIDIGGQSTRPGSTPIGAALELERLKPILDTVYNQKLYETTLFSIDSFEPEVVEYALSKGFSIVNDITGLHNDELCRVTATYDATAVIMHMQGTPVSMQTNPTYSNLLNDVSTFFKDRLDKAESFGISKIILDVGIGFGKTLEHNLMLIRDLEHFRTFKRPLLIGASRKSMIDKITPATPQERLGGTLTLHLEAAKNGAAILRVHDVKEHMQALKVQETLFRI